MLDFHMRYNECGYSDDNAKEEKRMKEADHFCYLRVDVPATEVKAE